MPIAYSNDQRLVWAKASWRLPPRCLFIFEMSLRRRRPSAPELRAAQALALLGTARLSDVVALAGDDSDRVRRGAIKMFPRLSHLDTKAYACIAARIIATDLLDLNSNPELHGLGISSMRFSAVIDSPNHKNWPTVLDLERTLLSSALRLYRATAKAT